MDADLTQSRFASVLMVLAGVWLVTSPAWISVTGTALTSLLITGGVITLAGLVQYFWKASLPSWIAGLAAVWLLVSTFVFTISTAAVWSQAVSAVVALALAYWDGFEVVQYRQHRSHALM
jgi:hypothetical protein